MQRFKSIFYLVGEEAAPGRSFTRAVELARDNDARLTVAYVVPHPDAPGPLDLDLTMVRRMIAARRRDDLERLAATAAEEGIDVGTRILDGPVFLEAIREVVRGGHDLLIKVAEGETGLRARFFGSTDKHLMRKCPAPVWLLDPEQSDRFGVVLAAVDVGETGPSPLNARIVQLASSLAEREGADFHVVHAWELYGETLLRSHRFTLSDHRLEELLRAEARERRERLLRLLEEEVPGAEARIELRKGDPARVIELGARKIRADILVMGTVARSGIPGLLIGNTAESVLGRVRCSVLTVKPDGFHSPVELEPTSAAPGARGSDPFVPD